MDSATERVRDAVRSRRNAEREFRPIFVAGAIGSGTSLLAISLAQRFQVAGIATESARQIDPGSILWVDRVYRYPTIRAYTDVLHPRPDWTPARVREDLLALYRAKAEHDSAEAFVDKGPNVNLVRARLLLEAFPSAHFLLIFRDPVANVEGFRRKWTTFAEDSLDECIRFWRDIHEQFLDQTSAFADRVVAVEYEAIVERYEEILVGVAERLGLEPTAAHRLVSARESAHGRGLRGVEGGRIRVITDANARSYAMLDGDEIEMIRDALAPLHERLRAMAVADGFAANSDS